MYGLRFHPAARLEAFEALLHYSRIDSSLAHQFEVELSGKLVLIQSQPLIHRIRFLDIRRVNFQRFPYCIFFRLHSERIEVFAVAHTARQPNYWIPRIDNPPTP